jgi:hypothetical protein
MLLAYGSLTFLLASVVDPSPRTRLIPLLGIVQQIQFAFVAALILIAEAVYRKRASDVVSLVVLLSPGLAGLALDAGTLAAIPYKRVWEVSAAVHLSDAVLLSGYFAGYAERAFSGLFEVPVLVCVAAVFAAALAALRSTAGRLLICGSIAMLLYAWGLQSPVAPLFARIVEFKFTAAFREVYDLLGFVAICYVMIVSIAARRVPIAASTLAIFAPLLALSWISTPPSTFWVDAERLPRTSFARPVPNERFALFPAFQPLRFGNAGSGMDPDLLHYRDGTSPINSYLPLFPENAALSLAAGRGDLSLLARLSVGKTYCRPYLREDVVAQTGVSGLPNSPRRWCETTPVPNARPEMVLQTRPAVTLLPTLPGNGAVFFADAPHWLFPDAPPAGFGFVPETPQNDTIDARTAWVDARLTFTQRPQAASALGGAATTSSVPYAVRKPYVLAYVDGSLAEVPSRRVVAGARAYRWVRLAPNTRAVICRGFCVVSAQAAELPALAAGSAAAPASALRMDAVLPWLTIARFVDSEPVDRTTLRYAVRFDTSWIAIQDGAVLPHVKIDGVFNGWLLANARRSPAYVVHWVSALQAMLSCLAVLYAAGALFRLRRRESAAARTTRTR